MMRIPGYQTGLPRIIMRIPGKLIRVSLILIIFIFDWFKSYFKLVSRKQGS